MIATASFSSGLAFGLAAGFIAGGAFVLGAAWLMFKLVFLAFRNT
jgi:hypothetical protein